MASIERLAKGAGVPAEGTIRPAKGQLRALGGSPGWVGGDQLETSAHARARAHTERTSRYGKEPHDGEH